MDVIAKQLVGKLERPAFYDMVVAEPAKEEIEEEVEGEAEGEEAGEEAGEDAE